MEAAAVSGDYESFCDRFASEGACVDALFSAKWPAGFVCPRCSHTQAYALRCRRLLYECSGCGHQTSLLVGTVMEGSRTPLRKWFLAMFLISRPEKGTSAVEAAATLKVTYKTAWLILHKLRHVMQQANGRDLLSGIVRVNTAKYGNPYNFTMHQHPQEHYFFAGASIDEREQLTKLRVEHVAATSYREGSATRQERHAFMSRFADACAVDPIPDADRYKRSRFAPIQLVCKQMCRWINDTFHGIGPKHLQAYFDEFCWRFNNGIRGFRLPERLLQLCAATPVLTYKAIIGRPAELIVPKDPFYVTDWHRARAFWSQKKASKLRKLSKHAG